MKETTEETVEDKLKRTEKRLEIMGGIINSIDDYLEYHYKCDRPLIMRNTIIGFINKGVEKLAETR
jgi:hypothetical protein